MSTYIPTTARDEVAAGAKLLDEKRPGWYDDIDIEGLNLIHCGECILGQLFGWFDKGLLHMDLDANGDTLAAFKLAEQHGFMLRGDADAEDYLRLTAEWRDLIIGRQDDDLDRDLAQLETTLRMAMTT